MAQIPYDTDGDLHWVCIYGEIDDDGYIKIGKYIVGKNQDIDTITDYQFRIGMVFQNPDDQFICDNVRDEIELGLKLYHYDLYMTYVYFHYLQKNFLLFVLALYLQNSISDSLSLT